MLKHRFATATSLYSKAVTSHGKPRSTLALAWQALRERFRRHMASQRGLFEERMSQRSSRSASARSPGSKGAAGQVCAHNLLLGDACPAQAAAGHQALSALMPTAQVFLQAVLSPDKAVSAGAAAVVAARHPAAGQRLATTGLSSGGVCVR